MRTRPQRAYPERVEIIVCALLVRDGLAFLAHRTADRKAFANVWDFPGGHVEPGETRAEALVREVREELGVEIAPPLDEPILHLVGEIDLTVWLVTEWVGMVANAAPEEHDDIGWFTLEEALALDMADDEYRRMLRRALGGEN